MKSKYILSILAIQIFQTSSSDDIYLCNVASSLAKPFTTNAVTNSSNNNYNNRRITERSLESASLMLSLQNEEVTEFELHAQTIIVLDTHSDFSVTLKGAPYTQVSFRGFVARLMEVGKPDRDTTSSIVSADDGVRPFTSSPCSIGDAKDEKAITHTNRDEKGEINFDLKFTEPGEFVLAVVVGGIVHNDIVGGAKVWSGKNYVGSDDGNNELYYSRYSILVESPIQRPLTQTPQKNPSLNEPSVNGNASNNTPQSAGITIAPFNIGFVMISFLLLFHDAY